MCCGVMGEVACVIHPLPPSGYSPGEDAEGEKSNAFSLGFLEPGEYGEAGRGCVRQSPTLPTSFVDFTTRLRHKPLTFKVTSRLRGSVRGWANV